MEYRLKMGYNPSSIVSKFKDFYCPKSALDKYSKEFDIETIRLADGAKFEITNIYIEYHIQFDKLKEFIKETSGTAKFFVTWEHGDSFSYLYCQNGKVSEWGYSCFEMIDVFTEWLKTEGATGT